MATISGKSGSISVNGTAAVHACAEWSISETSDTKELRSTATAGGTARVDGNVGWSGTARGYGSTPPAVPGAAITFEGLLEVGTGCSGAAIVESTSVTIDIEGGGNVTWSMNFTGNAALTRGAPAFTADSTTQELLPNTACILKTTTLAGAETTFPNVRKMTLEMTAAVHQYSSTDLAGIKKAVAGNFDCTFSADVYTDDLTDLPAANLSLQVKMYVDATTFWDIKWIKFDSLSNVAVDIENGAPVGATISGKMSGYEYIGAAWTKGYVKNPAAGFVWGS